MADEHKGRQGAHALWAALKSEHERYLRSVSYIPTAELKLQEDLRRYLCLRCAGFIEQVTYVAIVFYLEKSASGPALAFAKSYFQRTPNLRTKPLIDLIARFGPEFSASLDDFLDLRRRTAMDDLLDVRNHVAHGKNRSGRKLDPAPYLTLCEEMYEWLQSTFFGATVEVLNEDGRTIVGYDSALRPMP